MGRSYDVNLDTARERELLDLAGVAYLVTDRVGKVVQANNAAATLLAISAEDLIGKPLASFVPKDDRREFRRRLLELEPSLEPARFRAWFTPPGRRPFKGELRVSRTMEGTKDAALSCTLADITEQTSAEAELRMLASELEGRVQRRTAALRAESARLSAVVETIPAGLVIVDAEGNLELANETARGALGLGEGETTGWMADVLPLERTLATGEAVSNERVDLVAVSGATAVLEVSTAPVRDPTGQIVGALALFQDVTEQEQRERAEREFVTNAAHQLQSPLAGIISAVEVLQGGAKDGPERDIFLRHIERESNRLARLTRALLVLARAQTGGEAPRDEVVALEPLLAEVAVGLRPAVNVNVNVSCPSDLAVITNRELVEQALVNIAENAAKYTLEGEITIGARPVDGAVEIVVSDTGPGIADQERPRVTERFYRGSPAGSDGFGLGFAIVRSAVQALDGELAFDEYEGGGTVVRIRLQPVASLVETE